MRGSTLNPSLKIGEVQEKLELMKASQVSLIRQELVTLTGNHSHAVVLNQLLYWTQRTKDFSSMVEEERNSSGNQENVPQYGWIYKTADALIKETLLQVDRTTIRRYLNFLVKEEWLFERSNPQNKWDRTTQYRVNVRKVQQGLMNFGLSLSETSLWRLENVCANSHSPSSGQNDQSNVYTFPLKKHNNHSNGQVSPKPAETSSGQNARSNGHNARSSGQNPHCNTETTTEITNREHTTHTRENQNEFLEKKKDEDKPSVSPPHPSSCPTQTMVALWEENVGQHPQLTKKRKQLLSSVLERHFQNDLNSWEAFCHRLKASPFLMGEGPRGWRVTLDWILVEENLLKVLEGNFDDPAVKEHALAKEAKQSHAEKTKEILTSIEDPVWREWCTQFSEGIRLNETLYRVEPLSLYDLEGIANARLLELEGEKLLWVGSSDSSVLNKIEDLRLTLSSYFTRTYPKFRTIRTRLIESSSESQSIPMIQAGGPPLGETLSSEQTHHNFTKSQQKGLNHA